MTIEMLSDQIKLTAAVILSVGAAYTLIIINSIKNAKKEILDARPKPGPKAGR